LSYSLDTVSAQTLKAEAKTLREARAQSGQPVTHAAALEEVSRNHGYRDWNTARAALPDRVVVPFQVGMRVKGYYLEQPFRGLLIGVKLLSNMQNYTVTVLFDEPVNVTPNFMFAAHRHRVTATIDVHGITPALRGNGQPQMQVMKE
jgi:hypothetical protein